MKQFGMKGVELMYRICVLVVFTDSIRKALPDQDIIQGRFHRTLGKGLHLSIHVMRCSVKCTQDTTCRSFVLRSWVKACILGSNTNIVTRDKGIVYMKVQVPGYCPTEMNYVWSGDAQLCYRLETHEKKSWYDAKITCSLEGGHLIKLDTPTKNDFIMKVASEIKKDHKRVGYYIGLRKLKKNGGWTWYDNTSLSIPGWGHNEPNGDGLCAQIRNEVLYKWNDVGCAYKWGYICEIVI